MEDTEKYKENLYKLHNIQHISFFTKLFFQPRDHFQFIDTYQSPGTITDGLDWLSLTSCYIYLILIYYRKFHLHIPHVKEQREDRNIHLEETSEVQLVIGKSVDVHTSALCCKCLKLCSMLTCTISASIFFAFPD